MTADPRTTKQLTQTYNTAYITSQTKHQAPKAYRSSWTSIPHEYV